MLSALAACRRKSTGLRGLRGLVGGATIAGQLAPSLRLVASWATVDPSTMSGSKPAKLMNLGGRL